MFLSATGSSRSARFVSGLLGKEFLPVVGGVIKSPLRDFLLIDGLMEVVPRFESYKVRER